MKASWADGEEPDSKTDNGNDSHCREETTSAAIFSIALSHSAVASPLGYEQNKTSEYPGIKPSESITTGGDWD